MSTLTRELLRRLAEWRADGAPVASVYLDVDGRRFPRLQDVAARTEDLCRRLREQGDGLSRQAKRSLSGDAERVVDYVRDLDRGSTRGLALFSCSSNGLWEEVRLPRPVAERVAVAEHPHVTPLEVVLETYERFCTVIVDRERARVFVAHVGAITERSEVFDDVPGGTTRGDGRRRGSNDTSRTTSSGTSSGSRSCWFTSTDGRDSTT